MKTHVAQLGDFSRLKGRQKVKPTIEMISPPDIS